MGNFLKKKNNKRKFLKKTALLSAAAAISTFIPQTLSAKKTYNWKMVTTWPKNFPGLGTGAEIFANMINEASGGRINITVFGAGEIVPAFEAMDAVSSGAIEMGHGGPYYWKGKVAAAQYLSAIPFGLTPQEQNSWFEKGGGQKLADQIYKKMGCKFFVCGNTGPQMGGWFNKKINTIEDFKGLKMRIPGLGGEVIKAAGGTVVNLHGGELLTSIQSGAIDALEWVGPYNDLAFGIYKAAKYYYYPGWHEPATMLDGFIDLKEWENLDNRMKEIVKRGAAGMNLFILSRFQAINNSALQKLTQDHGVKLRAYSDELLKAIGNRAAEVLPQIASKSSDATALYNEIVAIRESMLDWSTYAESAFLEARKAAKMRKI